MSSLNAYLTFAGNTEAAMTYYADTFNSNEKGRVGGATMRRLFTFAGAPIFVLLTTRSAQAQELVPTTREIVVQAGTVLSVFLPYEFPGPWGGAAIAGPVSARTRVVASADLGAVFASGSTRVLMSVGLGARVAPSPCVPVWAQLGVGVTGYVERIGVVLPARDVTAVDGGVAATVDLAIGVALTSRWEVAFTYDHRMLSSGPGPTWVAAEALHQRETLSNVGSATLSFGVKL